jgi:ribosome-associated translation inhibitor RaiA
MLRRISGLGGRDRLRAEVVTQIDRLEARRGAAPQAVRVAFFDDDGPRGGVAIRCALTLTPAKGPILRVEHTARAYAEAFKGALTILTRQLKRRVQRRRRRLRYPRSRPATARRRLARRSGADDAQTWYEGSAAAPAR